jgi:uncharacterized protein (DUF952 family)
MIEDNDYSIKAKCGLDKDGDGQNICFLTETSLMIKQNGKTSSYPLSWVRNLTFKTKKYLIPIVIGGIVAPLAAIGLFQYYLNPWVMMSVLLIALLGIYYGIEGGLALCVETPIKEYDFFIKKSTPNLRAFVAFVMADIRQDSVKYYIKIDKSEWSKAQKKGYIEVTPIGIELTYIVPEYNNETEVILNIVTEKIPIEIKYVENESNDLAPKIFQHIPISHITISGEND